MKSITFGYVMVVAACAALGAIYQDSRFYLAALALTLPCGIAAFVAAYGGYALLAGVGGLVATAQLPDGSDAAWLTVSSGVLNALLFAAAAWANAFLVARWRRRRSGMRAAAARP